MTIEHDFARLIDLAPKVQCPRCEVEMTLRTLVPVPETTEYRFKGRQQSRDDPLDAIEATFCRSMRACGTGDRCR